MTKSERTLLSYDVANKADLASAEEALQTAVQSMERFVAGAKEFSIRMDRPINERINEVMHQFAWGLANASTSLATAQRYATQAAINGAIVTTLTEKE